MRCHICEEKFSRHDLSWSCCGGPCDDSSGSNCHHEDGQPTCSACGAAEGWWDGEVDEQKNKYYFVPFVVNRGWGE